LFYVKKITTGDGQSTLLHVDGKTTEVVTSDSFECYPDGVFAGWARELRKRGATSRTSDIPYKPTGF
jgi:hypothetical protein